MTKTSTRSTSGARNRLGILVVLGLIGAFVAGCDGGGGAAQETKHLSGTFLSWLPVDEGHGYAYFSIKNDGTTAATAKCMISVKNDFGDFGFDALVGEAVGPGQTIKGRVPLSVGKGSFLINAGEVKDC